MDNIEIVHVIQSPSDASELVINAFHQAMRSREIWEEWKRTRSSLLAVECALRYSLRSRCPAKSNTRENGCFAVL